MKSENKWLRKLGLITLFSPIIIIIIWRLLWIFLGSREYEWDLHVSVSDFIQLGVIIVALFGPLLVKEIQKNIYRPIIKVSFEQKYPYIYQKDKKHFSSEFNNVFSKGFENLFCCLKIKNIGKTKLESCEGVLTSVWFLREKGFIKNENYVPENLKWIDCHREEKIDINPEREYLLGIAFANSDFLKDPEGKATFRIYNAKDVTDEMKMLSVGTFKFEIQLFSSNAEKVDVNLILKYNVTPIKGSDKWKSDFSIELVNNI